jgi:hypothetical protein
VGLSSPELRRAQSLHLRRTIARRRTALDFTPSSGQHSLTGAEQITGTPPPLRRALTGGKLATTSSPAGSSSPELRRAQSLHLRRTIARRRTALRFHAQLRPTFAHRSRANYRNPTSVEKGAHRRKARHHQFSGGVLLAGAEASAKSAPPTNHRSTEDSLRFHAQLRPTFAHRSRANYRNPTSVEKSAHRRKAEGKLDTRRRQHFFDIIEAFHSTFVE